MMTMSGSNLARQRSFTNLILMEGPLLTMSHSKVWKEWRKRWFVLSRDHLRIFKSKQDTRSGYALYLCRPALTVSTWQLTLPPPARAISAKPHTTVRLLQCSVKASDRFEDKKLCFEITTPEQSILVLAENADEMRNWIFTIRQASGRYVAVPSFSHTIVSPHSWPHLSIECSPKPCRTPPSWGKVNSPLRTSE